VSKVVPLFLFSWEWARIFGTVVFHSDIYFLLNLPLLFRFIDFCWQEERCTKERRISSVKAEQRKFLKSFEGVISHNNFYLRFQLCFCLPILCSARHVFARVLCTIVLAFWFNFWFPWITESF
jgi:hypothetical protein